MGAHHGCIKAAYADLPSGQPTDQPADHAAEPQTATVPDQHLDVRGRQHTLVAKMTERYSAVQELVAQGRSLRGISRDLHLDYYAVRRYARASSLEGLLAKATHRPSRLDPASPNLAPTPTNAPACCKPDRGPAATPPRRDEE